MSIALKSAKILSESIFWFFALPIIATSKTSCIMDKILYTGDYCGALAGLLKVGLLSNTEVLVTMPAVPSSFLKQNNVVCKLMKDRNHSIESVQNAYATGASKYLQTLSLQTIAYLSSLTTRVKSSRIRSFLRCRYHLVLSIRKSHPWQISPKSLVVRSYKRVKCMLPTTLHELKPKFENQRWRNRLPKISLLLNLVQVWRLTIELNVLSGFFVKSPY